MPFSLALIAHTSELFCTVYHALDREFSRILSTIFLFDIKNSFNEYSNPEGRQPAVTDGFCERS